MVVKLQFKDSIFKLDSFYLYSFQKQKVLLAILQNSQENTCARVPILIKL